MKPLEERIEEIQKKMDRKLSHGQNDEVLNSKYRELLAEKFKNKTPSN